MSDLKYTEKEQEHLEFFLKRKEQLMTARTSVFGQNVEDIWRQADEDYLPNRQMRRGRSRHGEDWGTSRKNVDSYIRAKDWRETGKTVSVLTKIQTALSILVTQNPQAVLSASSSRHEARQVLLSSLYERLWVDPRINTRSEVSKFIFNLAKYGWACGRRFHKKVVRKDIREILSFNPSTGEHVLSAGKDKTILDDVFFENKSPWSVWIDDLAKPNDPLSRRDWMWKEVYSIDEFQQVFGKFKNAKFVKGSNLTSSDEERKVVQERQYTSTDLVNVYFYENINDTFLVVAGDENVLVVDTPLPYLHKSLSLVDTLWMYRNTECPYGIGLPEVMRGDKNVFEKFRNMTIDQITASIYKSFFYNKVEQFNGEDAGDEMTIEPGRGYKVMNPKDMTFVEVPGPGQDAYRGLELCKNEIDNATGITPTLEGVVQGKTAFETSQAQNSALKRLSTPLENIKLALEWDALLAIDLMKQVYSEPKVYKLLDKHIIDQYLESINSDEDLFFTQGKDFFAMEYREFPLGLEKNETGIFEPSEDKKFFTIKPADLDWEGTIQIKAESLLQPSKALEREQALQLFNIITPLILDPQINVEAAKKPIKELLKVFEQDPKKWLPDAWLTGNAAQPSPMQPQMGEMPQLPQGQQLAPTPQMPTSPMGEMQMEAQANSL